MDDISTQQWKLQLRIRDLFIGGSNTRGVHVAFW